MDSDITTTGWMDIDIGELPSGDGDLIAATRLKNLNLPISKADDFYALALTIWEIFTGKIPFAGLDESEVEKRIEASETVNLSEIAELDIRGIIEEYLKLGNSI